MKNDKQIAVVLIDKSIKFLRKVNRLTQEELARKSSYSVRSLRRIENYGIAIIDTVNTFALIFKVKVIDILNRCFILKIVKIIKLLVKNRSDYVTSI